MSGDATQWRAVGGVPTAWFATSGLVEGAALARRVGEVVPDAVLDLRAAGVRVRVGSAQQAEAAASVARGLGAAADPAVLQRVGVVLESGDPSAVGPFWQRVLAYGPGAEGGLADPLRRDPSLRIRRSTEQRLLRNRVHLDVVRPAASLEQLGLGAGSGPYGVRHADPEGNEVDLVPGDGLGEGPGTADWRVVFGAMACYRTTSPGQQVELAAAAAAVADAAGFPLLVDLRPGVVVLDSGKDQAEADAHGLDVDFPVLAADLQAAARGLGAEPDPGLARFVQVFVDAADVAAVRAFWVAALGYGVDRRTGLTDIVDPRRLDPVLAFQEIDASETERRRQRNRIHVELAVPPDLARTRLATALEAGGRLLGETDDRWRLADPEDNELVLSAASGLG